MGFPMYLFYIFPLLVIAQNSDGTGNNSVIEDLRQPAASKPTEITTLLSPILMKEENGSTSSASHSNIVSRVKRQYYDNGYYNRNRYYPYPLPIFIGGGGFGGPWGGRYGGGGFGGRGFGGRGFGGRGIGGRGVGGIGGRGVGGGRGGGGGRG